MSKFSVILVLMFSYPFILFMMRIQELRELRGIVIAYSGGYPFSISGDIRSVPS